MSFPPPIRITAPLLALVFGLIATWFDYRLNLDLDLARHLREVNQRADSSGRNLARESEQLLKDGNARALASVVQATPDVPELELVAVVDGNGKILTDSDGGWEGDAAAQTPLARPATLINAEGKSAVRQWGKSGAVISAHPLHLSDGSLGWALQIFDRTHAIAEARANARTQLGWMASAMALLSLAMWAVLHFGFATRLGRLADGVRAFGEGRIDAPPEVEGGDEVAKMSRDISTMANQLRGREAEQLRLEREVLEISESERRRIGHDLHDGLGQRLTATSMTANAFIGSLRDRSPALSKQGEEIGRQLREAIAEVRSLSHGLAPVALLDDGLMAALSALCNGAPQSNGTMRCVFECPEPVYLRDGEVAGHYYRIAQEAINNALKHSHCSEIRVALTEEGRMLDLEVDDDGDGFDEREIVSDGIGLRVMRYRAKLIGATLAITSPPAGGTRISCRARIDD